MQIEDIHHAFKHRIYCGRINNTINLIEPLTFLAECMGLLVLQMGKFFISYRSPIKLNFELACEYVVKKGNAETLSIIYHNTKMVPLTFSDDFSSWYKEYVVALLKKKMDEFQERDSGKALKRILYLDININKFQPTNGGSSFIRLPASISGRKACVNVKNDDERCFVWSILSAVFPVDPKNHPDRTSSYPQDLKQTFNIAGINFPTPLSDIPKFERQNDISINVYGLDQRDGKIDVIGPLYYTKLKKDRHINLLYFKDGDRSHYCWIKNISRLLSSQLSKNNRKKWVCDRCLQYFGTETLLSSHTEDCKLFDAVKIELPSQETKWLQFKNFMNKERHPYVLYADFESLTCLIDTCQPDPTKSYTNAYQNHIPCAVGFQVVCSYNDTLSYYDYHRGPDSAKWFMSRMKDVAKTIEQNIKKTKVSMNMSSVDEERFINASTCHICSKQLGQDRVRDHCHLSGKFRGAAHNGCNLNYQIPSFIPVFFHNLSGYDSHLFVKELVQTKRK